jgi:saccharopine dehydrogenase-like NADP-dependent oxidoreductase
MAPIETVRVVGLGKVGELVGRLLHEASFDVIGVDVRPRPGLPFEVVAAESTDGPALRHSLEGADAVVCCLPFASTLGVAEATAAIGAHYFDLTEDVATTERVRELAASGSSDSVFAPQCGLAPGLIGIVGASVAEPFDEVRSIELRVGALPRHPVGMLGYAFIWSPEGVVNEYLNDCEVIRDGKRRLVPAMTEPEAVVIGGTRLEAFLTSGGLGTMCETYEGRVERLDYKTLRYPGHFDLMRFVFDELLLRERRDVAGEILVNAKPPVDDDIVYLYAAVEGRINGELARHQYVRAWRPRDLAGGTWRAISWTTACSACGVVELVARGELGEAGFLRQEAVPLASLLKTRSGAYLGDTGLV